MGVYDVDAMLAGMSSRLLTEWMAYYNLEPFGDEILDIHFSRLASLQVSTKKHQIPAEKFRLWKRIAEDTGKFDPQKYFDDLKESFRLKKE